MIIRDAVAVVTGGAAGIGEATCRLLEAEGARVVSWDVTGAGILCDVTDPQSVKRAMVKTVDKYGIPTVLVANAGISYLAKLVDIPPEEWDRVFAVNVRGVFLSLQVVARELISNRLPGSMVIIGSVNGTVADPAHSMYSSSKAAVMHLARCAAVELGPSGIRVNAIAPGPTATPMMARALSVEGYAQRIAETTPLGRIGTAEDIADGVLSVLKCDWITGQVIALDGGSALSTARGAERVTSLVCSYGA
jgi:NAD(P)-dependent dehydrogenase (short-subunit alcohol dehydrogenase family)